MVVARATVVVCLSAMSLTGCSVPEAPLAAPVSCEAVLAINLGDDGVRAISTLGRPYRGGRLSSIERVAGLAYDEWWAYSRVTPDMGFRFWDDFSVHMLDGRIVLARAFRSYGDSRKSPDGTNPRLALSLVRAEDGTARREIGPAFKDVFGCDPPTNANR